MTTVSKEFETWFQQKFNVGVDAYSHLAAWKDRYYLKSPDQIEADLYINHDPTIEIERAEEAIGRKLTSAECNYVTTEFNEAVMEIVRRRFL